MKIEEQLKSTVTSHDLLETVHELRFRRVFGAFEPIFGGNILRVDIAPKKLDRKSSKNSTKSKFVDSLLKTKSKFASFCAYLAAFFLAGIDVDFI
jgi:hypothetical protein